MIHHRPRTGSSSSSSGSRSSPLLPSTTSTHSGKLAGAQTMPSICGVSLKYISLLTLAVQNASLSIVMHYSRVSTPPHLAYSPASAVLLNELLKGTISFLIAVCTSPHLTDMLGASSSLGTTSPTPSSRARALLHPTNLSLYTSAVTSTCTAVLSHDAWKLSIPALLYVVQNSLQFVAIGNLPVATFQVTNQMKILTTAACSVGMLGRRLGRRRWMALVGLAVGVGIVQIQSVSAGAGGGGEPGGGGGHVHVMNPVKGFAAVTVACFTSGLAGVYFEMVLKNSKTSLWVRNVQLSLFSLPPAILSVLLSSSPSPSPPSPLTSSPFAFLSPTALLASLFHNFGPWAWATVLTQVLGGLLTALVIKYSDNIMKGFATSLSIVLSFLASVVLFEFRVTGSFVVGAGVVLGATWVYNAPEADGGRLTGVGTTCAGLGEKAPVGSPIIGEVGSSGSGSLLEKEKDGYFGGAASPYQAPLGLGSPQEGARATSASPRRSTFSAGL